MIELNGKAELFGRDIYKPIEGAPNFKLYEFFVSVIAVNQGISNDPKDESIVTALELLAANILQPVRNKFGAIKITSGYRSSELCKALYSSPNSNHTRGEAADFEPIEPGVRLFDVLEFIHHNLEYRELIAEYYPGGWNHVAYRAGANDKILKLKDPTHSYDKVSLKYIKDLYEY